MKKKNLYKKKNNRNSILSRRKSILIGGAVLFAFCLAYIASLCLAKDIANSKSLENNNGKEIGLEKTEDLITKKREEIKQIQKKINEYILEINEQKKKERTLKREMAVYQSKIEKNKLEIKETELEIEKTKIQIEETKFKMENNKRRIEKNREILKKYLRLLYSYNQNSILEILITKNSISDFFSEINAVNSIKNKIFDSITDLKTEKKELRDQEINLTEKQEEQQNLIKMKIEQNTSLNKLNEEKRYVLIETKGEEKKFQQIIEENKKILPILRSQLRNLQSLGKKIKYNDAISSAKYVGSITGVNPAYLLGILKVESNLGTNVGGGNYKIDMRASQRPVFEEIVKELGYNPDDMPVSKKPRSYKGWGGAMGPAQFMPTTWKAYKNEISQVTGNYPPDPWNLTDAIAAMAVKVSKVPGVIEGDYNAEYKAAGLYFAGRKWKKFLFYPNNVMLYTNLYSKEIY